MTLADRRHAPGHPVRHARALPPPRHARHHGGAVHEALPRRRQAGAARRDAGADAVRASSPATCRPTTSIRCSCCPGPRRLHEIGLSVAHSGYHKHSAYILSHADMPGFSKMEQARLSHAGAGPPRLARQDARPARRRRATGAGRRAASGGAVPSQPHQRRTCRRSRPTAKAPTTASSSTPDWLRENPLTAAALREETREWRKLGVELEIKSLRASTTDAEATLAD